MRETTWGDCSACEGRPTRPARWTNWSTLEGMPTEKTAEREGMSIPRVTTSGATRNWRAPREKADIIRFRVSDPARVG